MRDLYHRADRLAYWLKRIDTDLDGSDNEDVLSLVRHMQDRERSALWIIRCITILLIVRRQLQKPFREVSIEDIRSLLHWIDNKGYKASSNEKFRKVLKFFFKVVYGNNRYYPEQVDWIYTKVSKEKAGRNHTRCSNTIDMDEYLEEDEVQKLIESIDSVQKKAFISCMYESGARPEEFLRLTNTDIRIDSKGAILVLRGKTGERRVRIIAFTKLMQQWLNIHPLKHLNSYPMWVSEATNYKNNPLGLRGAEKIIEEALPKSGLTNKHARLYILRHSRATHLAKHLTEAQLCVFFGWIVGTKVVRRYIHLSGRDVDNALIALNQSGQVKVEDDYKIKSIQCKRCSETMSPSMNFCAKCALPVNLSNEYTREEELEKENKYLKEKYSEDIKAVREQMNRQFNQIMSLIQQNPQLAYVKPEILSNKAISQM
jgi:integrase/recombinase XerD